MTDTNVTKELFDAIEAGDLAKVKLAVENGGDLKDKYYKPPLLLTCIGGIYGTPERDNVLEYLLSLGLEPQDEKCNAGYSALRSATLNDYQRSIDLLLAAGADPNDAKQDGTTPLSIAAKENNIDLVKKFLPITNPEHYLYAHKQARTEDICRLIRDAAPANMEFEIIPTEDRRSNGIIVPSREPLRAIYLAMEAYIDKCDVVGAINELYGLVYTLARISREYQNECFDENGNLFFREVYFYIAHVMLNIGYKDEQLLTWYEQQCAQLSEVEFHRILKYAYKRVPHIQEYSQDDYSSSDDEN